jgi:hypothetical protein
MALRQVPAGTRTFLRAGAGGLHTLTFLSLRVVTRDCQTDSTSAVNANLLIHSIIQQSMIFTAQLATAGGVRVPLASLANQVFLDLASELRNQGLKHSIIADMFGITLRSYHRRVRELEQSRSVEGSTVWEAVLGLLRESEPVSAARIHQRFALDDQDVVAGVLSDLVSSGLAYGSGRGKRTIYRIADQADFGAEDTTERSTAKDYLVWQAVYRRGPLAGAEVAAITGLGADDCAESLERLASDGRIRCHPCDEGSAYSSARLDVPVGQGQGWEAAVFDHFQAVVSAIANKLRSGVTRSERCDTTGGATYSLDIWRGHPLEAKVLGMLAEVRRQLEALRAQVDAENAKMQHESNLRVIFYMGQDIREDEKVDHNA